MIDIVDTPALLLEPEKVAANCRRMRERLQAHGVQLRPHVKTAKNVEVAREALGAEKGPITVSTLREAEYFFYHGFDDILYAVGMVPSKVARMAALARRGAKMTAIVDSVEAAEAFVRAAQLQELEPRALIEIDSDGHRAGVPPASPLLLDVARALGDALQGVMTHAGDSYICDTPEKIADMAERERRAVVDSATALRKAGFAAPVVSVGSTPTATFARSFEGVTEVRIGVYVFNDLVMAGLGVCGLEDVAVSVAARVIGNQREKHWLITDAGWMAMSRDRGTAKQRVDQGYGLVCDADGRPFGDLIVVDANQEHGIVARRDRGPLDFDRFPIGTLIRVLPNHACATAAQFGEYQVVRDGRVVDTWERFSGW